MTKPGDIAPKPSRTTNKQRYYVVRYAFNNVAIASLEDPLPVADRHNRYAIVVTKSTANPTEFHTWLDTLDAVEKDYTVGVEWR